MLEFDDIQHILLMRVPALTGRYEFLSFRNATGGRTWLSTIREKVQSAAEIRASVEQEKRWVTVAFTWNGPRGDARRHRSKPSRLLGRWPGEPESPRHRYPFRRR